MFVRVYLSCYATRKVPKERYQRSSSGLPPLSRTSEVRLEQFAHIKRDARGSIYATPSGCLHFACWGNVYSKLIVCFGDER